MAQPSLHPAIDNGVPQGFGSFDGGTLACKCPTDKVLVHVRGDVAHNHACGCSKCWKPEGALFSIVGVVPVDKLKVIAHEEKLHIVDESATIQRHACKVCGTHMYGRIVKDHPFKGLDFIHVELSDQKGWQPPQFAGFLPSIVENGYSASGMDAVKSRLKELGLPTYDALSPPLMAAIANYNAPKAAAPAQPTPVPPPPAPKKGFFARLFGA